MNRFLALALLLFCVALIQSTQAQTLLLGTTQTGGEYGNGGIFEFEADAGNFKPSFYFDGIQSGANPGNSMTSFAGVSVGITTNGGSNAKGTLVAFSPITRGFSVLHSFGVGLDGAHPSSDLMVVGTSVVGTTSSGGAYNKGTLFEYDAITGVYQTVHHFGSNATDGTHPGGSLVYDGVGGLIYGTTTAGGSTDDGVIYEFNWTQSSYRILTEFNGSLHGSGKKSGVVETDAGIGGVAEEGGSGDGAIYNYNLTNGTFQQSVMDVFDFGTTGAAPQSFTRLGNSSLFYGMAREGGANGKGTIFIYNEQPPTFQDILTTSYDFIDGANPEGGLYFDGATTYYGTTSKGGMNDDGTIFSYETGNGTHTKLFDFISDRHGANPSFGQFMPFGGSEMDALTGPHAPALDLEPLDSRVILKTYYDVASNNDNDDYQESDASIVGADPLFRFQGYQVFQVVDPYVTVNELGDPALSRLVSSTDITDTISGAIVNFEYDASSNSTNPVRKAFLNNTGVEHTLEITTDLFNNNAPLVNGQEYYYMAVAYAYNRYRDQNQSSSFETYGYLPSKTSADGSAVRPYTVIPNVPNALYPVASYGDGVEITRIEGSGNGGLVIDLTDASRDSIRVNYTFDHPTYQTGKGPLLIKVVDPLRVPEGDFSIKFDYGTSGNLDDAMWELEVLTNTTDGYGNAIAAGTVYSSTQSILARHEQVIDELGLSITIVQTPYEQVGADRKTPLLESTIEFADDTKPWLAGISDQDGFTPLNWIRSGTQEDPNPPNDIYNDYLGIDDLEEYENVLGGWWAPWRLVANEPGGPVGLSFGNTISMPDIADINSVDIILTNDTSKWTRCAVVEMHEDNSRSEGGASKSSLRASPSVNKLGQPDNSGGTGMGWFPGYAIDLENGERLNMAFGEDSYQTAANGRDMIWNPTSDVVDGVITGDTSYRFAGRHYIYVFNNDARRTGDNTRMPLYDEGVYLETRLNGSNGDKIRVWRSTMWVGLPALQTGETLLSTDVKIRLRVNKPYEEYTTSVAQVNGSRPLYEFSTAGLGNLPATRVDSTICDGDSVFRNGDYLTNANTYTEILTGSSGDSIVYFTLVLDSCPDTTVTPVDTVTIIDTVTINDTIVIDTSTIDTVVIRDTIVLSVNPNSSVPEISIYPNPSSGNFTLNNVPTGAMIRVYAMDGREVAFLRANDSKVNMRLNESLKGLFLIRVIDELGVRTGRILVE